MLLSCQNSSPKGGIRLESSSPARWVGSGFFDLTNVVEPDTLGIGRIRSEAVRWLGVPYLWGGEGPNQVDCSAYVRAVFRTALHLELPRTASKQAELGVPVALELLQPGDLLFFGPRLGEVDHVGIYWGAGWFINATVSRGVAFSHLSESFWSGRIRTARRMPIALQKE